VFARITTFYSDDPSPYWELELRHRLRVRAEEVLRQVDGYEGLYVFIDRKSGKLIAITLWESEEAMQRSEEAVKPLRKEMSGGIAANVVDVGHYEVGEILEQERRERELVEQELRLARSIQQASLPKEVPKLEGWEITPFYQPAKEVGGDFYDFHPLSEGRLGLVVGGATGKGVPAVLVMSTSFGMLRLAAQSYSSSPGEILRGVNEALFPYIPSNMFVTCFYCILDPKSGSLTYANAGHDPPYLHRGRGEAEELKARGMPLGLMSNISYEQGETSLTEGDSVLFYSDGLVEAHDPEGEMFGFPRLRALVAEHGSEGERPLGDLLLEELYSFVGEGWEQEDDITLLALGRSPTRS